MCYTLQNRIMIDIKLAKKFLRSEIKFVVKALSETQIRVQSNEIEKKIFAADWFHQSQRISVYISTQNEVITDNIIKEALNSRKDGFIPRFDKVTPEMRMLKLQSLKEYQNLGPSVWGIKQHSRNSEAEDYFLSGPLDLVLVPGCAFTRDGKRLGKGMGYYDRFFAEHHRRFKLLPKLVGLAFKQQIVDDLVVDEHDINMDIIVSP